ncbi:hypothetical protein [Streptomyces specialis]|uniref:hypothetical protein n=1 Tax=Streptomyces specialis TaxID=498367 RepID=UPI00073F28EE|nr:hypothetical protein [Streptomyces specialis]
MLVPSTDPATCRITVCRDCCCGSAKVPGIDHTELTTRLARWSPVTVSRCLGVCEQANVVVVHPSAPGRAAGGRPVWLALVNSADAAGDICDWVRLGGPGTAALPAVLGLHLFTPPRRTPAPGRRRGAR